MFALVDYLSTNEIVSGFNPFKHFVRISIVDRLNNDERMRYYDNLNSLSVLF